MTMRKLRHVLKLWYFGPCAFPGGRCAEPGIKMFHPHANGRPVYLCSLHDAVARNKKNGASGADGTSDLV
jgi:hypothetical protein